MPNACFCNPSHPISDPKITRKNNLEIDMKNLLFWAKNTQTTLQMDPLNHQKIDKIRAWTSQGPSLCPPMSQDRPRVPQDAKVEAPSSQITTMGKKIHQKSIEIQAWTSKCPLLCSLVSQKRPRVPQDTKVKLPIMRNNKLVYQKAKIRLQQCRESAILEQ